MTFNEAKLRTKLGMKVKLPRWMDIKYVSTFHDDNTITYHLKRSQERTRRIPESWIQRTDWELYHD